MGCNQGGIHQQRGEHRLDNTHGNGLPAHMPELLQPELISDGKGNKAQSHLGDDVQIGHFLRRVEANIQNVQCADTVGAQKQSGHQIGGHGGKIQLFGQTGHQEPAYQGKRQ